MTPAQQGVLTRRALNRALLARQMLLAREKVSIVAGVEKLVAMQAQIPRPPFMGLWTRLQRFEREDLIRALREKKLVRATALRGTIHLMSRNDYVEFRPLLGEMLAKGADSIARKNMKGMDVAVVCAGGREFFGKGAFTFDDYRKFFEGKHAPETVRAMAYTVRMGVPLVMVPADATWAFPGNAGFTLAKHWLGDEVPDRATGLEPLILRYLAAFGPATPGDFQTWSFLQGTREIFEKLRPKLVTFRDERKRELFDLPKAPRPDEETPAPVRFLPEYDNALLAHDDRARIIDATHTKAVFTKNLQVLGTVLVDGFVAGGWRVERKKKDATLHITPFGTFTKKVTQAVQEEGDSLVSFLEPEAATCRTIVARR